MAGHSRPKDGVASARLCPAMTSFCLICSNDVDARHKAHKAGHDDLDAFLDPTRLAAGGFRGYSLKPHAPFV
jgi:hypothetical protein